MTNNELERFLAKVSVLTNGCWQWTANIAQNGYSKFKLNKKNVSGHRVSYEFFTGAIDADKEIDHLCRNRACVNPTHLEQVIHSVNVLRGALPQRNKEVHTGKQYMRGFKHSPESRAKMRAAHAGVPKSPEHCAKISAMRRAMSERMPTCRYGHPYDAENTYRSRNGGKRQCRICRQKHSADRRAREQEKAA